MSTSVDEDARSDAFAALSLTDPPRAHDTLDSAPETLSVTLETLPNELISVICFHLGSFVLPALSKRLLPFHRSQLYRDVNLDTKGYELFHRSLDSNETLLPFVEHLALDFYSGEPYRSLWPLRTRAATVKKLVSSLPSLKSYAIWVPKEAVSYHYPKPDLFSNCPTLETVLVSSCTETLDDVVDEWFKWGNLRCEKEEDWRRDRQLYEDQGNPAVVINLKKNWDETYSLQYSTSESTEIDIHAVLRSFPLSRLEIVAFTHSVHLKRLLDTIPQPHLLKNVSLFSFDSDRTDARIPSDYLSRFSNLTRLALGGTSVPTLPGFFEFLRSLPLETLRFGPHARLHIQDLINLLKNSFKPELATLKRLVLSNINARAPKKEEEDEAEPDDWVFPMWTEECSKAKVQELRDVAKTLAIKRAGTTFKGLKIVRSAAYRAAVRRKELEESEESEVSEVPEESDGYEEGDYSMSDSNDYEGQHDGICGCPRPYHDCWQFADYKGWPRSRATPRWRWEY
ncbi:hypothetical protein JCM3766R1_003700 [Sporobolomyces carnicolor]